MPRGGKREPGPGKKLGRTPKEKIAIDPLTKGIATRVLAQIEEEKVWLAFFHIDALKKANYDLSKLDAAQRADIKWALDTATNRRDGKPAQGMFTGDTRENAPPLARGNLPSHFERPVHASGPNKPN